MSSSPSPPTDASSQPAGTAPATAGIQPLPGAERIRALAGPDAIFKAFDGYPWKKDANFMTGLLAMLGDPSDFDAAASATINDMATHARVFYYSQRVGVAIDFAEYKAWLDRHPDHKRPMFLPESPGSPRSPRSPSSVKKQQQQQQSGSFEEEEGRRQVSALADQLGELSTQGSSQSLDKDKNKNKGKGKEKERIDTPTNTAAHETPRPNITTTAAETSSPPATSSLSWQSSAPRTELFVNRPERPPPLTTDSDNPDEPSYPLRFAEMIRMLQEGVDIPGIRQVPDTIIRDPMSKPFGARVAPRKPWEKDMSAVAADIDTVTPSDMVDLEFPPVDIATS